MKLTIGALALVTLTSTSAFATPNLLYPVTGDAFRADVPSGQALLYYNYGALSNTGSFTVGVEASVGHGTGTPTTSFTIAGYNSPGQTLSCQILLHATANGNIYTGPPVSRSTAGFFQFAVTSPSVGIFPGSYTYNVSCLLPPNNGTIVFGVTPTGTSTYFTPMGAASFHGPNAAGDANLHRAVGQVSTLNGPQWIEGSLGYGQGGSKSFYFNGWNITGAAVTCYVEVVDYTNFATYAYSNTSSAAGDIHMLINTAAPAGNYIYTAGCLLPSGNETAFLGGVTPTAGTRNLLLPVSGDAFTAFDTAGQANLTYSYGAVKTSVSGQWIEAAVGHYNSAGSTTFTVTGYNAGGNTECIAYALAPNGAGGFGTSQQTNTVGSFSFSIILNPAVDNYVYSIVCGMGAAGSSVYGVIPNK